MTAVAQLAVAAGERLIAKRLVTELALDGGLLRERQAAARPGGEQRVDEVVHHVSGVVGRRGNAQQLLASRHRRVVDRLDVDAVDVEELVGDLLRQLRVSHLRGHRAG